MEGLNQKESIDKLQGILQELGIDGRPTLEKCKEIKAKRELEAELKEIMNQEHLIVEGKRRRNKSDAEVVAAEVKKPKRPVVESESEEEYAESDAEEEEEAVKPIDFSRYGDPEDSD